METQKRNELRDAKPQGSAADQYSLTLVSFFFYLSTLPGKGIETALKARGLFLLKTVVQHQLMLLGGAPRAAPVALLEGGIVIPLKSRVKFP